MAGQRTKNHSAESSGFFSSGDFVNLVLKTASRHAMEQTIEQRYALMLCAKFGNKARECCMAHPRVFLINEGKNEKLPSENNDGCLFRSKRCDGFLYFGLPTLPTTWTFLKDWEKESSVCERRSPLPGCSIMTMVLATRLYVSVSSYRSKTWQRCHRFLRVPTWFQQTSFCFRGLRPPAKHTIWTAFRQSKPPWRQHWTRFLSKPSKTAYRFWEYRWRKCVNAWTVYFEDL